MSPAPRHGGAREQVARLLTLVPYLHAHGSVHLEEAARALGSTPDQVARDLRVLFMVGLPGGLPDDLIDVDLDALEGDGVIRVSNADYLSRPLRFTPTEAGALVVALRSARDHADTDAVPVVDRALAKLERVLGNAPAASSTVLADPPPPADLLRLRRRLEDAAARGRQVRLRHHHPGRDEETTRTVDPRGVVRVDGTDYLDAWCHLAEAPRFFRLDRVLEADVLDDPALTAPTPPRTPPVGGLLGGAPTTPVALRLLPGAHWVAEYYPVRDVARADDGALTGVLDVADERWFRRLALRLAPHLVVTGPKEFTDSFTAAAAEALNLYRDPTYDGSDRPTG